MDKQAIELQQRIRQEQILSPQLRASLRVLQMDRQTLADEIRHEAETNPVVELNSPDGETMVSEEMAAEEKRESIEDESMICVDEANPSVGIDELAAERRQRFFDRQISIVSLQEHLMAQVPSAGLSANDALLAEYVIGDVDDDGRYVGSLEELSDIFGLPLSDVERVLACVQRFDPPGVGARDLRECLRIQAEELEVPQMMRTRLLTLIDEHLEAMALGEHDGVAEELGVTEEEYAVLLATLKTLEPKPGRPYIAHGRQTQYIRPELNVFLGKRGCVLRECDENLPQIAISPFYQSMLDSDGTSGETQEYLRERIDSALRLREAVYRRGETVMRVARAIFAVQLDFFGGGFEALKPLTIEEIARRTGYHGTTVGRAIRGKYVRTPRGVFELKRFFCVGKLGDKATGTCISAVAVKRRLASLCNSDELRSMTDDELTRELVKEGVRISRRTVSKYRNELGVPSTSKRGRKAKKTCT